MSIHVCKCGNEWHLRYPGLSETEAQSIADKINAGALTAAEPLRAQVAVLRDVAEMLYSSFVDYVEGGSSDEVMEMTKHAITDTQATSEQFKAECEQRGAVKALEDAASDRRIHYIAACNLRIIAEELLATSKKAG